MIIQSKNIWIDNEFRPAQLIIQHEKIVDILPYNTKPTDLDVGEQWVMPGFISIHDHGYNDGDANNATNEHIREWRKYMPSEGVTSLLPSTSTETYEKLENAFKIIRQEIEQPTIGCKILGINAEGPFLSVEKRGAHNPKLIVKPDIDRFYHWQDISGNNIKMVTIAPENDHNLDFTRTISKTGVIVSIGHTNGTYEDGTKAVEAGANNMTHLYNAMTQMGHRSPGIVGVGLAHEHVYAELICDGVHVDFAAGKVACLAKGKEKLIAITDAVRLKGLPAGIYTRPDSQFKVTVSDEGIARLDDGRLAGSTNKMNKMAYNLVHHMDQSVEFAILACTANPAALLKVDHELGHIKPGYYADIIVSDDQFNIHKTFVNGELVYEKA